MRRALEPLIEINVLGTLFEPFLFKDQQDHQKSTWGFDGPGVDRIRRTLEPFIGEAGLIYDQPRSATVQVPNAPRFEAIN